MKPVVKAIKAVVLKRGRILLLYSKKYKRWNLPGGKLEGDENKLEALKREFREELGIDCKPVRYLCNVRDEWPDRIVDCEVWLAEAYGSPKNLEPDDTEKLEWFAPSKIPEDSAEVAKQGVAALNN